MWIKVSAFLCVVIGIWAILLLGKGQFNEELIKGKRVLVTGASSGIGEQIAYHYAQLGASLVITARRESHLQRVITECKNRAPVNTGSDFHYILADMNRTEDREQVLKFALERLGGIDHLILNHAFTAKFSIWNGASENITLLNYMMNVNFLSFAHLASLAIPELSKSKGSITAVSSIAGKYPLPYTTAYSTSKHALNGFFKGLRHDFSLSSPSVDISITLCTLGFIDTDMSRYVVDTSFSHILRYFDAQRSDDAAMAIIKGTSLRQRELVFPRFSQNLGILPFLMELFPDTLDQLVLSIFRGYIF